MPLNPFRVIGDFFWSIFVSLMMARLEKAEEEYRAEYGLGPAPPRSPELLQALPEKALPAPKVEPAAPALAPSLPSIPLPPPVQKRGRGRPPKTQRPIDPSTSFDDTIQEIKNGLPQK